MAASSRSVASFFLREAAAPEPEPERTGPRPEAVGLEATSRPTFFSAFNPEHMGRVGGLMLEFGAAMRAAATPEAGVEAVVGLAEEAARTDSLPLAQHALGIFAAHAGKSFPGAPRLPIPPMVFEAVAAEPAEAPALGPMVLEGPGVAGEDLLHWFREDLFLNEHHRHWHIVYSTIGALSNNALRFKGRQGEVFLYMHQQMLARYDTERFAAGLPPVEPMGDLSATFGDGYDPNAREPANIGYVDRADGLALGAADVSDLDARRAIIRRVITDGVAFGQPVTPSVEVIGTLMESNLSFFGPTITTQAQLDNRIARMQQGGFQLHNFGHGAIAVVPTPANRVMNNPHTSLKDPVFWRWHRMIDDIAQEFYVTLPPYQPDPAEQITLRKGDGTGSPDVLVIGETLLRNTVDLNTPGRDTLIAALVDGKFGEAHWDDPLDAASLSDELRSGSLQGTFVYQREVFNPQTGASLGMRELNFRREHLISERFAVVVRAENAAAAAVNATLRVFICADTFLDLGDGAGDAAKRAQEHRFWIELERIPVALKPGRNVLIRLSDQSSIVRKLQGRAPWPTSGFTEADFGDLMSGNDPVDDYCDCGWPLNLHLPKGTTEGMGFHIMAMVSAGVPGMDQGACGSRAFCGAGFDDYPEVAGLNLGFPFDRPAPNGTLAMIAAAPNMAVRRIKIRHDPALATDFGLPVS